MHKDKIKAQTTSQKILVIILISIICFFHSFEQKAYGQTPKKELNFAQKTLQELGIEYKRDAFIKAIEVGDIDVVTLFIDSQLEFECSREELIKESILLAVRKGHVSITKFLLDTFSYSGILDNDYSRELIKPALYVGNISLLKLLLDRNIGSQYIKSSSLPSLSRISTPSAIKLLTQRGLIVPVSKEEINRETRIATNEAHAVEAMRLFHSVEATYQAGVGNGNFGSAEELFIQQLIDPVLASAAGVGDVETYDGQHFIGNGKPKFGYNFLIIKKDSQMGELADFSIIAIPSIVQGENKTGNRSFYVDATGIIRGCNNGEVPTENSSPIED